MAYMSAFMSVVVPPEQVVEPLPADLLVGLHHHQRVRDRREQLPQGPVVPRRVRAVRLHLARNGSCAFCILKLVGI